MIYLVTGVPGAGKTLYALNFVKALSERERRPVFYSGIRDCILPWTDLDPGVAPVDPRPGAEKWHELPAGSIVVIDECQSIFRPRGHGQPVPRCVAELETHRHKGVDLVLVTQHPMLLDTNVRRLVGTHFHVMRKFGMQAATVHEWGNGVKIECDKARSDSVRHEFRYPRESYGWYKSAEVHTHKRRIPARVFFLLVIPFVVAACGYGLYHVMWRYATKEGAQERIQKKSASENSTSGGAGASVSSVSGKVSRAGWTEARSPRVPDLPFSAPIYDEVVKPVRAPYPAACVFMKSRGCRCYTDQATLLQVSEPLCRSVVERGYFVDWDVGKSKISSQDASGSKVGEGAATSVSGGSSPARVDQPVVVRVPELIQSRSASVVEIQQAGSSSTSSR